jgi:hypothetical protein
MHWTTAKKLEIALEPNFWNSNEIILGCWLLQEGITFKEDDRAAHLTNKGR